MQTVRNGLSNALGVAMLLQAVASLIGGILLNPLIKENNIATTLLNLAYNQTRVKISLFVEIITALGIIWLGVMLFRLLRDVNHAGALTALAFYILEAALLLMSRFSGYALTRMSDSYSVSGNVSLEVLGQVFLDTKGYIGNAALIPFGIGALIFYYLLFMSRALPSWLPLWGLVAVAPIVVVSVLTICGVKTSFVFEAFMVPYVPFEFFAGAYILTKGLFIKL